MGDIGREFNDMAGAGRDVKLFSVLFSISGFFVGWTTGCCGTISDLGVVGVVDVRLERGRIIR